MSFNRNIADSFPSWSGKAAPEEGVSSAGVMIFHKHRGQLGAGMPKVCDILRSEDGMSMALALFLFLICTLLASVVVAAGTASVGQHAKQVESERQYYSVSSAARAFSSALDGQEVVLTLEKSGDIVTTVDGVSQSAAPSQSIENAEYRLLIDGKDISSDSFNGTLTVLESTVLDLMGLTVGDVDLQDLWDDGLEMVSESVSTGFSLQHDMTSVPEGYSASAVEQALYVDIMERTSSDGKVTFTFSPHGSNAAYSSVLTLDCDVEVFEDMGRSNSSASQSGDSRTETQHVVSTKTLKTTWHSCDIAKAGDE